MEGSSVFLLLLLLGYTSAAFSSVYSNVGGARILNHLYHHRTYQEPIPQFSTLNSLTHYSQQDSYLPRPQLQPQIQPQLQPQIQPQFQAQIRPQFQPQLSIQTQIPAAIPATTSELKLSPLPFQSLFTSQLPTNFELGGQNSFFYSPTDQALYKITKISLNGIAPPSSTGGGKWKGGIYGAPTESVSASAHVPASTTTPALHVPDSTTASAPEQPLLPPTPAPAALSTNPRPSYNTRPSYSINFKVFDNAPAEPSNCNGGGEGLNPQLSSTLGADPAQEGCPPAGPVGDTPQVGVPVPLGPDPDSSFDSSQFQPPPVEGAEGQGTFTDTPSISYGPPSKYGPPPKYGAPPRPKPKPITDDGIAGTGSKPSSNRQVNGYSFSASGTVG